MKIEQLMRHVLCPPPVTLDGRCGIVVEVVTTFASSSSTKHRATVLFSNRDRVTVPISRLRAVSP